MLALARMSQSLPCVLATMGFFAISSGLHNLVACLLLALPLEQMCDCVLLLALPCTGPTTPTFPSRVHRIARRLSLPVDARRSGRRLRAAGR